MSADGEDESGELPAGTQLQGFRLIEVLGHSGFGIRYRAEGSCRDGDGNAGQDGSVVIMEFLPDHLAHRVDAEVRALSRPLKMVFEQGLQAFLDEGLTLAEIGRLDHIEHVHSCFRANGTGYRVLEPAGGVDLETYLSELGRPPEEAEVHAVLLPLLTDLARLHAAGVCHLDITPQELCIRPDGTPVLIGFGTRQAPGYDVHRLPTQAREGYAPREGSAPREGYAPREGSAPREGYAPPELYWRNGRRGPWTDLYALAAIGYRMVTGTAPPDGLKRRLDGDDLIPATEAAAGRHTRALLAAIDGALALDVARRPQSALEWRAALAGRTDGGPPHPAEAGEPGETGETDGTGETDERLSSRRSGWRLAVMAALAVVLLGAIGLWQHHEQVEMTGHKASPAESAETGLTTPIVEENEDRSTDQRTEKRRGEARQPGTLFRDCSDRNAAGQAICPEMMVIPAGSFRMGSPESEALRHGNEEPLHWVTIPNPLAIGRTPVTFDEWEACLADGGCAGHHPADKGWGHGRQPVIDVSWSDAHRYVAWLGKRTGQPYRLPSEAEWEYAARAGTATPRPWGLQIGHNRANCAGCGSAWDHKRTAPVGSFPPNRFGLQDMLGNVWQWVEDCYHDGYDGAPDDGSAWTSGSCSYRVLRGGSWFSSPSHLRSAYRGGSSADYRGDDDGFRVARSLDQEEPR